MITVVVWLAGRTWPENHIVTLLVENGHDIKSALYINIKYELNAQI